jgi:hypothetical protein
MFLIDLHTLRTHYFPVSNCWFIAHKNIRYTYAMKKFMTCTVRINMFITEMQLLPFHYTVNFVCLHVCTLMEESDAPHGKPDINSLPVCPSRRLAVLTLLE